MKTHIKLPHAVINEISYCWIIFCHYAGIENRFTEHAREADIIIGNDNESNVTVSDTFIQTYQNNKYHHEHYFDNEPLIRNSKGEPDYLSTCFYMMNCIQEFGEEKTDAFGRFPYELSYQKKFNCYSDNLVCDYFDKIAKQINVRAKKKFPKKVFLSHDLDIIKQGDLTEAKHYFKKGKPAKVIHHLARYVKGNYSWLNCNELIKLHQQYNYGSCFFWLTEKGRYDGIANADYRIDNERVRHVIKTIEKEQSFFNGLHKSTFPKAYTQELNQLPPTAINRNHFLLFQLPEFFEKLEQGKIRYDCSLGFANQMGFRNNFGLPFYPFDIKNKRVFPTLEIPVNMMDTPLQEMSNSELEGIPETVYKMISDNEGQALISLLWHNNYLTDGVHAGIKKQYLKLLEKLFENGWESCGMEDFEKHYTYEIPDILR